MLYNEWQSSETLPLQVHAKNGGMGKNEKLNQVRRMDREAHLSHHSTYVCDLTVKNLVLNL
jgi:hypothetical protein